MNRLTYRLKDQYSNPTDKIIVETDYTYMSTPKKQEVVLSRLAAIEDILGDEYDLDELKEVVQAKREGRCVVLPCKIGDTLYRIQRFKRGKNRRKEAEFIRTVELNRNNFWRIVMDGEIGKTVFLTRAEAEAALRREQDGNNK